MQGKLSPHCAIAPASGHSFSLKSHCSRDSGFTTVASPIQKQAPSLWPQNCEPRPRTCFHRTFSSPLLSASTCHPCMSHHHASWTPSHRLPGLIPTNLLCHCRPSTPVHLEPARCGSVDVCVQCGNVGTPVHACTCWSSSPVPFSIEPFCSAHWETSLDLPVKHQNRASKCWLMIAAVRA